MEDKLLVISCEIRKNTWNLWILPCPKCSSWYFYANHIFIIAQQVDIFNKYQTAFILRFSYRLETHYIKACAPPTINNQFSTLLSCRICDYAMIGFLFWKRVELIAVLPYRKLLSHQIFPWNVKLATNNPKNFNTPCNYYL